MMSHSPTRRLFLLAVASLPFTGAYASRPTRPGANATARSRLAALEAETGGRLGVAAMNSADGVWVGHRADERFPFCSTFKALAAAAVLKRSASESGLLQRRVVYTDSELVTYSPITTARAGEGMTLEDLCSAALRYSDNTAANLLLRVLGGPAAVTEFARSIGDDVSRLDRWETSLNSALPGDPRDTTTPAAMVINLRRLLLGEALASAERERLTAWMLGNTTGAKRIRAGVPGDWRIADKTGTGDHGTTNDIAVAWPPGKPPIVLAVYFTQREKDAPARNDVVAEAARIVAAAFA